MPPIRRTSVHQDGYRDVITVRGARLNSAWTDADDEILWDARSQSKNWQEICDEHFPTKTANACRKRHERLREMRQQEDFNEEGPRFPELTNAYCDVREDMWSILARHLNYENWQALEKKVFSAGLKTVLTECRNYKKQKGMQVDNSPSFGGSQTLSDVESPAGQRTYGSPSMSSNDMNSRRTSIEPMPVNPYKYGTHHEMHSVHQSRVSGNKMAVYAMLSPAPSYAGQNFGR